MKRKIFDRDALWRARNAAHMTMSVLAAKADTHASVISAYETGKKVPQLQTLHRLARAIGVNVRELMRDAPE